MNPYYHLLSILGYGILVALVGSWFAKREEAKKAAAKPVRRTLGGSQMDEKTARAIRELFAAASYAHKWVLGQGGPEFLRDTLEQALADAEPVRLIAEEVLDRDEKESDRG